MRNTGTNQIEIVFIRHGKTPGNLQKRYIGRTDESLSEQGKEELAGREYPKATYLFASPMKRCKETATILYPNQSIKFVEEFREIDFGEFEGKNYRELSGDDRYQAWIDSGGTLEFPGGESRQAFIDRSLRGMQKMMREIQEYVMMNGDSIPRNSSLLTVTAVVHGGTIMAILSGLYGGDYYDYQISNGDGFRVTVEMKGEQIRILQVKKLFE